MTIMHEIFGKYITFLPMLVANFLVRKLKYVSSSFFFLLSPSQS